MPYGLHDENGVLLQKQPNPASGFIEIPSSAICGMVRDAETGEYSLPPVTLTDAQNRAIVNLMSNYNTVSASLLDLYQSPFERSTWNTQVFEANLVTAAGSSGANDTPFFDAFVAENPDFAGPGSTTNQNKALLKQTIEANNAEFAAAAGSLTGQLSAKRHAIVEAATNVEVEAVDLTFVIPTVSLTDK